MLKYNPDIVWKDVDSLIPYVNNTKKHPDKQIDHLAGSIAEFGFDQPIVVDGDDVVIKGHGRLLAAKKLQIKQVPVLVRTDLTPAQVKAARIADNKVAESEWDIDLLKLEFEEIKEMGLDLSLTGFDFDEINNIGNLCELPQEEQDEKDENYTRKVEVPVYVPSGEKPRLTDIYNNKKTIELIDEINQSSINDDEKEFLIIAAQRHTVLNFKMIADYYAHSDGQTQELMEKSALIIIDFNKAIEYGYVELSENIAKQYKKDYENDE